MAQIVMLNVSLDPALLETRTRVLQTAKFIVVPASSIAEATDKFLAGDFDAVLVCHSISINDRRRLARMIHEHSPLTPIVLVSSTGIEKDASVDVIIGNDPEQLVQELPEVLHKAQQRVPIPKPA
jgi:DNA-binding response OmpR family regulator